ncbi:MAG: copper-translocating P-type ATPase [Dehalococcoidia bacterium]|nr:copper-translocating P-type ATPase [Dehalococcoidia bacterium]
MCVMDQHTGHAEQHPDAARNGGHEPSAHAGHMEPSHGEGHEGHMAPGGGHQEHGGHVEQYRRLFWVSLLLSLPVFLFSDSIQGWLNYSLPAFPGDGWVAPLLGTAVFLYGGRVFLQGAADEARRWQPGMMLLISLAIAVAFLASAAATFGLFEMEFWWELAALVDVMLLGHWQEMRALGQARGALQALAALLPDEAERVVDGGTESVPIADLRRGDTVLVRPGARVPADGEIIEGRAEFDESMLTGESRPVSKDRGDRVVAGAVAAGAAVRVRVDAVGEETALAGIQRLVEQAQTSRSHAQALADRAAALLFYVAIGAAVVTWVAWAIAGDIGRGTMQTVTVLVISCPHALGLAIPLVIAIGTGLAARHGILVKDRLALERMRTVQVVLFDKTGTLTRGEHVVTDGAAVDGNGDRLLRLAAAAEADSEHPLARAIVQAASPLGALPGASDFRADPGRGVTARVEGSEVAVGGPGMLRERGLGAPDPLRAEIERWKARGATVLYTLLDGQVAGALALEDEVRPESREAVDALHDLGVRVGMITGDAREVADAVAAELGIDEVFAEVLPDQKASAVAALQADGLTVAMVGDGVNDAPALALADVGIAIGAGTDVAIESAGVVLASDDPRAVINTVRLSQAAYRKMLQNLAWAVGYNALAIPLAAGVLAPWGLVLPPSVGALLMSASTIVVALNAQLLRRVDLTTAPRGERSTSPARPLQAAHH